MKFFIGSLLLLALLLVPVNTAYAVKPPSPPSPPPTPNTKVTICHVLSTPHQTLSVSIFALGTHLIHGDTRGACPEPPVVPEFGLISGAFAALASGGAFLLLKRRSSKS